MPAYPLLDPGNRILGWSTGDFSLYGAQPAVTLDFARPGDAPATESYSLFAPATDAPVPDSAAPAAITAAAAVVAFDAGTSADHLAAPPPATFGFAQPAADHPDATQTVPAATGSSGFISPPTAILAETNRSDAHDGAQDTATSATTQTGLATALAPPVLSLASQPAETVSSLTASVVHLTDPALAAIGHLADGIPDVTQHTAQLLDSVAASAQPVSDTAATAVDALGGTVESVDHLVATLAASTQHALDATIGAVESNGDMGQATVSDLFGGSDPVGGISTLLGLVETEHGYDLAPVADASSVTASGSIVDALASDVAPGSLIGDAAHDLLDHGAHDAHHDLGLI